MVVDAIMDSFTKHTDIFELKDLTYMIENFKSAWRDNFTWKEAHLNNEAMKLAVSGHFYGTPIKGKEIIFKREKFLGRDDLH